MEPGQPVYPVVQNWHEQSVPVSAAEVERPSRLRAEAEVEPAPLTLPAEHPWVNHTAGNFLLEEMMQDVEQSMVESEMRQKTRREDYFNYEDQRQQQRIREQ